MWLLLACWLACWNISKEYHRDVNSVLVLHWKIVVSITWNFHFAIKGLCMAFAKGFLQAVSLTSISTAIEICVERI